MNEFYPLDFFLHFKKSDSYPSIFLKNEKFKKSRFCKLQKSSSEVFRVYRSTNDFTFSNPQVIQELNLKAYDDDVLNDGNNYAYRIFKNVPTEGLFFYHTDNLMTPLQMTDENQSILWQAEYYPFGRIYSFLAEIENNLRFPGQYSETDLNLYYNWHRWYNSILGRYESVDLIIEERINPYIYSLNNPISFYDFKGLQAGKGKGKNSNCPPELKKEWQQCVSEGLASFCTENEADYKKVRCVIWAESSDNQNAKNGEAEGLMQIKWRFWEEKCKKQILNFDKKNPCHQIKCGIYILCKEYKGKLGSKGYGTKDDSNSSYKKCMDCCQ